MPNSFLIFITVSVIIALIYAIYKIMLGSDGKNDEELQITSHDILEQVSILYKHKKYSIAENLAKRYLDKRPADDDVRAILSKVLHSSGRIYESIEQAKIVVNHKPKNFHMKIFLANCFVEISKPGSAVTELREVLNEDPNNAVAIKELAQVYFNTNQKQSAVKMYKQLEEFIYSNQEKVKNKTIVAQIYIEFQDYDSAINEYKEILEIYPTEIEIKKKLVDLYKKTYEYDLLIDLTNEILDSHTSELNDLWAIKSLREIYSHIDDYVKALEYAYMVKEHPLSDKVEASECIARLLMETGQVDESIQLLALLVKDNAQNIDIKKTLANSYLAKGDFEAAVNIYKKILDDVGVEKVKQIHFELSNIFSSWAWALFEQQENVDCFKKFATALQYDSKNPEIYYQLGAVNQAIKNYNESISQYKKAIELNNENFQYYYSISECYEAIDSFYEEKKALNECVKLNPNHARVHYRLALLAESQHDTLNSMIEIKRALELDPNFLDAKYKLALMLELHGDTDGAIALYEEIVVIDPDRMAAVDNLKMLRESAG